MQLNNKQLNSCTQIVLGRQNSFLFSFLPWSLLHFLLPTWLDNTRSTYQSCLPPRHESTHFHLHDKRYWYHQSMRHGEWRGRWLSFQAQWPPQLSGPDDSDCSTNFTNSNVVYESTHTYLSKTPYAHVDPDPTLNISPWIRVASLST